MRNFLLQEAGNRSLNAADRPHSGNTGQPHRGNTGILRQ